MSRTMPTCRPTDRDALAAGVLLRLTTCLRTLTAGRRAAVLTGLIVAGLLSVCRAAGEPAPASSDATAAVPTGSTGAVAAGAAADGNPPASNPPDASAQTESGTSTQAADVSERSRPLAYDLAPYRIVVLATFGATVAADADRRQRLVDELQRILAGRLRPLASVTVQYSIPLSDVGLEGLDDIAASAFDADADATDHADFPGKVIGLQLTEADARYAVRMREWDGTVQSAGPVWERSTLDRRLVPHVVGALLEQVFRPLGRITEVDGQQVELLMRAGDLQQPGERELTLQEGDYLVPILRYLNRDRQVRRIQPIPWTFLRTVSINRGYVTCEVISAFGSPLAGSRRRVELVAVRVQPVHAETRLTIIPHGQPERPLAATRVDVLPRLPTEEDPVPDRETLLTDRFGHVTLRVDPDQPLRYVRVYSGKHLLAQVPVLAGLEREVVLEVPDDTIRLRLEGELSQLEGDLIDVVARRAVLLASMRSAVRQNKPEQFRQFDERLKALPSLDDFERRLRMIRLAALGALQEKGDRAAQRNVTRLCDRVLELMRHHLDSDPIRQLREEMSELERATESSRSAKPRR